jgi:hypothetical protein
LQTGRQRESYRQVPPTIYYPIRIPYPYYTDIPPHYDTVGLISCRSGPVLVPPFRLPPTDGLPTHLTFLGILSIEKSAISALLFNLKILDSIRSRARDSSERVRSKYDQGTAELRTGQEGSGIKQLSDANIQSKIMAEQCRARRDHLVLRVVRRVTHIALGSTWRVLHVETNRTAPLATYRNGRERGLQERVSVRLKER